MFSHLEGSRDSQVKVLIMLCKDGEHSQATEIIEVTGKGKAKLPANTDRVMKTRCDPVFENTCHIVGT